MRRVLRAVGMAVPVLLSGCATFHQVHEMQDSAEQSVRSARLPSSPPVVSTVTTPYLLGDEVQVRHRVPSLLRQKITLVSSAPLTLRQIAGKITEISGIPVHVEDFSQGSAPGRPGTFLPPLPSQTGSGIGLASGSHSALAIPLNWSGSLSGLLDMVTAKNGVWWNYRNGAIRIFKTETRTFSLPALDWATNSSGSIVASAGADSNSSGSSGSLVGGIGESTGGSSGNNNGNTSTGMTSITNTSKIDVWKNLSKVAQTVAGGGQVVVDASTGTVTVTGTPPEVRRVRDWVQGLARQLQRQVAITVHVYNVNLNNEQNYGLNLSGAFQSLGRQYGVTLQGVAPPSVSSGGPAPLSLGANILSSATGALGQWQGSSIAVQALATLGHVTQVFSRSAISLNGEPTPIQVAQQTGYLAESSNTTTANVGTTSGLIPGTVTTGFTAMFLPKIVDGRILLGMNMTISNLVGIQTISSGGSSIQVPTVDSSTFQQSVKLKPGQTLLLTGYSQSQGSTTHNGVGSPYFPLLGGGADASLSRQMIAIVITARIL
ncbi:PilN family type IVB pilus formation outer membrane protein [Acidithiobacillus caldus]|uniref:Lipoprotein n=1 Tax=Acidithiobacillus caldus (strain ATCC 51756 / DSM 8584 / KU) TaxID=637389 RepID=A0A059ZSB4_ACICK|nr:PilN family type IVB pilus formation outer membrane protein [Acidithiobacillus caldus]AIA55734.1 Lipoprotein [Acidithiobacillus caldus ATCC 51756]MBU2729604.1 PilN family type IVB pilus formation outer membrane protein [Acidithiobacillus caldus]MBU2734255.1 PilN family type IVB pilus formation outer membrane protein [Acidithiobacillus caldus ATCC 51756]MBU2746101.1 PilN family type IVB pilus formation outer membrane protein [Acidithiobacillus caldus]MBU2781418.1 PilN family type IVB pilus f